MKHKGVATNVLFDYWQLAWIAAFVVMCNANANANDGRKCGAKVKQRSVTDVMSYLEDISEASPGQKGEP